MSGPKKRRAGIEVRGEHVVGISIVLAVMVVFIFCIIYGTEYDKIKLQSHDKSTVHGIGVVREVTNDSNSTFLQVEMIDKSKENQMVKCANPEYREVNKMIVVYQTPVNTDRVGKQEFIYTCQPLSTAN